MALCVVDGYDVDACGWTDAEGETVSKDRFEEDLVVKRSFDNRNTSEDVDGYGAPDAEKFVPSGGGLLDEEEWGGYIWRTFSIRREG